MSLEFEETVYERWYGTHTKESIALIPSDDDGENYQIQWIYLLSTGEISKHKTIQDFDIDELKALKKCIERLLKEKGV